MRQSRDFQPFQGQGAALPSLSLRHSVAGAANAVAVSVGLISYHPWRQPCVTLFGSPR